MEKENRAFLNNKLQRFVNRLLNRANNHIHNLYYKSIITGVSEAMLDHIDINNRRNIRRIPTKSITAPFDNDDFDCYMLFYGIVDVLYSKIEKAKVPFYKLTFFKCGTDYKLCSLNFYENVAMYVQNEYQLNIGQKLSNMCVAFFL